MRGMEKAANSGAMGPERRRVVLLGATGSIGASALRVVRAHPERIELVGVAAEQRGAELAAIVREFSVPHACLTADAAWQRCRGDFPQNCQVRSGAEGLRELATLPEADVVLVAVTGTHGLRPTLAAIAAGKTIALASKEVLVMAGAFVQKALAASGARLLPTDSEHNAIFQCIDGRPPQHLKKILLTASGGPFRDWSAAQMQAITLEQALAHPNWDMGTKITIDSATMANKGLEAIEARWLFDLSPDQIEVVVHPQSIVHSMVELTDGSILAQLSPPSMTFPIQHCLLYPQRPQGVEKSLDFKQALSLDFHPPDLGRFPCLRIALESLRGDVCAPTLFNAANEVAVERFVQGGIAFNQIPRLIEGVLGSFSPAPADTLDDLLACDREARRLAQLFSV